MLPQLDVWQWVLIAVVLVGAGVLALVAWRRRMKLKAVEFGLGMTGPSVKATYGVKDANEVNAEKIAGDPDVNVSGNLLVGKAKFDIRRKANVADNVGIGDVEISVGAKPGPKPKKPPRTKR